MSALFDSLVALLQQVAILPDYDKHITLADALGDVACQEGGEPCISLHLPRTLKTLEPVFTRSIVDLTQGSFGKITVKYMWDGTATGNTPEKEPVTGVQNIIAVASGKGGVGKSTTAVNLALALHAFGARVGVLDADIYGPSQSLMLGVVGRQPEVLAGKRIKPILTPYGIYMIGMGNLVAGDAPMAWRGPMAAGALQQMLRGTDWPDLDYLIVDMPPGTGDIQLTLAQTVAVNGSVIVTTPQDIALLDAKKGIELFRKVNIDVLGVVENMSTHTCRQCGHHEAIFGEEGGLKLAEQYHTQLLGRLPLKMSIRENTDSGKPSIVADIASEESQQYLSIAQKVAVQLWFNRKQQLAPTISQSDD